MYINCVNDDNNNHMDTVKAMSRDLKNAGDWPGCNCASAQIMAKFAKIKNATHNENSTRRSIQQACA